VALAGKKRKEMPGHGQTRGGCCGALDNGCPKKIGEVDDGLAGERREGDVVRVEGASGGGWLRPWPRWQSRSNEEILGWLQHDLGGQHGAAGKAIAKECARGAVVQVWRLARRGIPTNVLPVLEVACRGIGSAFGDYYNRHHLRGHILLGIAVGKTESIWLSVLFRRGRGRV